MSSNRVPLFLLHLTLFFISHLAFGGLSNLVSITGKVKSFDLNSVTLSQGPKIRFSVPRTWVPGNLREDQVITLQKNREEFSKVAIISSTNHSTERQIFSNSSQARTFIR